MMLEPPTNLDGNQGRQQEVDWTNGRVKQKIEN